MDYQKENSLCNICPRQCNVNRTANELGFCNTDDKPLISNIFLHKGEEPIISGEKGICNVFFAHCNLQCVYCQNYQISQNGCSNPSWIISVDDAVDRIIDILDMGVNLLGFVSPTHQIPQMLEIIMVLEQKGHKPTVVFNTNGYDSVETLKQLEGIVDVYLPDFKYFNEDDSIKYSGVPNYFEVASKALKEMYRQKGSVIILDDDGLIESGIIIRHLVLPGLVDDTLNILDHIAYNVSPYLHISLMSQYYPTAQVQCEPNLNRKISLAEYSKAVIRMEELGFKGWIQDFESSDSYRPDFYRDTPFL